MDDVIINKVAIIERCLNRISQTYQGKETKLETDFDCQDAILLNLMRACEASIDAAMHVVRINKLGIPQQSRDAFTLMENNGLLTSHVSNRMQSMVGFRNIAVHNYQELSIPILRQILEKHLDDFRLYAKALISISANC
jgi:uncharacterized protein YutE (UPF0331/DUF86 family)